MAPAVAIAPTVAIVAVISPTVPAVTEVSPAEVPGLLHHSTWLGLQ
jgi:hypothetical protein